MWVVLLQYDLSSDLSHQHFLFEYYHKHSNAKYYSVYYLICLHIFLFQQIIKRMRKSGFQTDYTRNEKFNSFLRRCCSLPFVPTLYISYMMIILSRRADDCYEHDARVGEFCQTLLDYIKSTWVNGVFSMQDWNLFDTDCQIIPTTNNGNESPICYPSSIAQICFASHRGARQDHKQTQ